MYELLIVVVFLIALSPLYLVFVVLPKVQQRDRRIAIERDMRQQLKDAEYEQQAARKILRENGIKG